MIKVFTVLMASLGLLCGCAIINESHDFADYHSSLIYDISFYSQYEIIYKAKTKDGEKLVVAPFLADSNNYLPEKITKLHFGLRVVNPNMGKFLVWIDYQFLDIDNNDELIQRASKLVYKSQELPEEFISIDLPYTSNIHSQVYFSVTVVSDEGRILYQSTEASYRIRGVKK